MFGVDAILIWFEFHGCVSHPFRLRRQHGFHRAIWFGKVLHAATDQCEHWLIIVPLRWVQYDAFVFTHRGRKFSGDRAATCSTSNYQQFAPVPRNQQVFFWKKNPPIRVWIKIFTYLYFSLQALDTEMARHCDNKPKSLRYFNNCLQKVAGDLFILIYVAVSAASTYEIFGLTKLFNLTLKKKTNHDRNGKKRKLTT